MALATAMRFVPMKAVHAGSHPNAAQDATSGLERQGSKDSQSVSVQSGDEGLPRPTLLRADSSLEGAAGQGTSLTLLEAALEAWTDCQPDGYTLPESAVPLVLPAVACRIPGSWHSPGTSQMLNELFTVGSHASGSSTVEPPVFQQMLKAHNGVIHFLHFWSAFSKASRLLVSLGTEDDVPNAHIDEGLTLELETLRDSVLRAIEVSAQSPARSSRNLSMTAGELVEAVQVAASMSSAPDFWRAAGQALAVHEDEKRLSLEDITVVILSWLRDAIAWEHERPPPMSAQPGVEDQKLAIVDAPTASASASKSSKKGIPVYIHIYDVSLEENIQKINSWLASRYSPVKFGGLFHAGVEVNGLEWSFGMSFSETMPGISCVEPKTHPAHTYRQTVQLRNTKLSAEEIADLLSQLIEEYPGDDYCLLRRNCCHFADDFTRRLGAGRLPSWVHRLARLGARVDGALQVMTGKKLIPTDDSDED